jgi:arylsulfatase A-like enzyme
MMAALDDGVGEIVAALRRTGIADDTLVLFASDHGCPTNTGVCSNQDLLGGKRVLLEGGVRVPLLAAWDERIAGGRVVDEPVSLLDVVPTAIELAGAATSTSGERARAAPGRELDGRSLVPLLRGEEGARGHDSLFWRHGPNWAVRQGSWKLVQFAGQPPLLFDLSERGERADVAAAHPEVVADLTRRYRAWEAEMVEPAWPNGGSIWASLDDLLAGKPIRPLAAPASGAVELP